MPRRLAAVLIVASLAFGALFAAGLVFLLRDSDYEDRALATMSPASGRSRLQCPSESGRQTARV
jgi:hypothetical protein